MRIKYRGMQMSQQDDPLRVWVKYEKALEALTEIRALQFEEREMFSQENAYEVALQLNQKLMRIYEIAQNAINQDCEP